MATNNLTYAREDLILGSDEQPSLPTASIVRTCEWPQKLVVGAIVSALTLGCVPAAGTVYHHIQPEERPTHASLLTRQEEAIQVMSHLRKIGLAEAIRLANANYQRVESLLDRDVERDALGTAVWE